MSLYFNHSKTRSVLYTFLFLGMLFGIFFVFQGSAKAAYADMPGVVPDDTRQLQFINLANNPNDPDTGGGAYQPRSFIKVYSNDNGAKTIDMDVVSRKSGPETACYTYVIEYAMFHQDINGSVIARTQDSSQLVNKCTVGPGWDAEPAYQIPINAGTLGQKPGFAGVFQTLIRLDLWVSPIEVPFEKTATLRFAASPGVNARLGYGGGVYGGSPAVRPNTIYPAFGTDNHILSWTFRAPCSFPGGNMPISWTDDDWNPGAPNARQNNDPLGRVYEYDPSVSFSAPTRVFNIPASGYGNDGDGNFTIPGARTGFSYELRFESIDGSNGIKFNQPYDSADFYLQCEGPPTYSIPAMTCAGITINVDDYNNSGQGVYYELYIYEDNDGSKVTVHRGRGTGNISFGLPPETAPNNGWVADLVVRDLSQNGSDGAVTPPIRRVVGPCYEASCSLDSYTASAAGTVPGSPANAGVVANGQFQVNYTLNNIGDGDNNPLYPDVSGYPLTMTPTAATSGTYPGTPSAFPVGQQVNVGASVNGSMTFTAPANARRYTVEVYPDYNGLFAIGAACTITVDVFQPFKIKPHVTRVDARPNPEDPQRIEYDTSVEKVSGSGPLGIPLYTGSVLIAGNNQLNYLQHDAPPGTNTTLIGPPLDNDPINNAGKDAGGGLNQSNTWQRIWNRTYFNAASPTQFRAAPPSTWKPGDQFCGRIDVDYNEGWTNGEPTPGAGRVLSTQKIVTPGNPAHDIMCGEVVNTPFIRAYGNDVISSGPVKAFMAGDGTQGAGSGGEFAAISGTTPVDFASAFYRSATNPTATPKPHTPDELKLAGVLRPAGQPKYFDETIKRETRETPQGWPGSVAGVSSAKLNNQSYHTGGGTLAGAPAFTGRHTMYVEGNVVINGDVIYGPTGATIDSIPSFTLIVKGNIYISHTVTRLDGMYIAQAATPGGADGEIQTCTNNGVPFNLASPADKDLLANLCSQDQLRVNGLLAADKLKFYRVKNTLRDIRYTMSGGTRVYTPRESFDGVAQTPPNPTKAGEAVRMTPEVMLGQYGSSSSFRAMGSQTGNKYEYIVTLPPIL